MSTLKIMIVAAAAEIHKNLPPDQAGAPEDWEPHAAWAIGAIVRKWREINTFGDQPKESPFEVGDGGGNIHERGPTALGGPSEVLHAQSKAMGYTGDCCGTCGNYTLVRNGTCLKCNTCGSTTGCS